MYQRNLETGGLGQRWLPEQTSRVLRQVIQTFYHYVIFYAVKLYSDPKLNYGINLYFLHLSE